MTRARVVLVVIAVLPLASLANGEGTLLVRVERVSIDDLSAFRSAGLPVVAETDRCLILRADPLHLEWLRTHDRPFTVLDENASRWRYAIVSPAGPSGLDELGSRGALLYAEEGWGLLRLDPQTTGEVLAGDGFLWSPLPTEPLELPDYGPPPLRNVGGRAPQADRLVQRMVDLVDTGLIDARRLELVENEPTGTRYSTHQGAFDAADYVFEFFTGLGLVSEYHQWDPQHAPNVAGELSGIVHPEEIYVIVAHLDNLPGQGTAPGADDNASGSVSVLESARVLSEAAGSCAPFRNTVRFLTVTGEEQGKLGSAAYAQRAKGMGDRIRGVINLDMVSWEGDGYPGPENLDVNYDSFSGWLGDLFAESAAIYGTGLAVDAFFCPNFVASDHHSFWQQGYPAIFGITDNFNLCGRPGHYAHYHSPWDTIENCGDPTLFYATVRTAVATLAELARPFRITFSENRFGCEGAVEVVVADFDLNTDPGVQESVAVQLWSTTETSPETLLLAEDGIDSIFFRGALPLTSAAPITADDRLSVLEGDTVTGEYIDAVDCDGEPDVTYTEVAEIECSPPVISGVGEIEVSDTVAVIGWNTDEPSDTVVVWGPAEPPQMPSTGDPRTTDHSVSLEGLQPCTVYHYEVRSTDPAGNLAVADNGGAYFHFETLGDFGQGLQPCHEGRVTLDEASWPCQGSLSFTVADGDLNEDPGLIDTAWALVSSTTEPRGEAVPISETGVDTSLFSGSIPTGSGSAIAHNGTLELAHEDQITAVYEDADDGTGEGGLAYDVAAADCGGPLITGVSVDLITDSRASLRVVTDEPADVTLYWGLTPALGNEISQTYFTTGHVVTIQELSACTEVYFRVRSRDPYGHETVLGAGTPLSFSTGMIPGLYWHESFEGDVSDWTLEGEWEVGEPQRLGGASWYIDPGSAYNNENCLGHDLSGLGAFPGDYEPDVAESALSPVLDASTWTNTKLLFYKYLNVHKDDDASSWLVTDSAVPLFQNDGSRVVDWDFGKESYDVAALVDGAASVQLEFRQESNSATNYAGWNVDDIIFKDGSLPDYAPCYSCATAPSFSGLGAAVDDSPCSASGVRLEWQPPTAWGSGGGGSYAVYRDSSAAFEPTESNRIAAGITDLGYHDPTIPADQTFYYLVRAEDDESCGVGPGNGGLMDGNTVVLPGVDWTSRPPAGAIDPIRLSRSGQVHVRIEWSPDPAAAEFRIYRATSPLPGEFAKIGTTSETTYEDPFAAADHELYFYLVHATNACGEETP